MEVHNKTASVDLAGTLGLRARRALAIYMRTDGQLTPTTALHKAPEQTPS